MNLIDCFQETLLARGGPHATSPEGGDAQALHEDGGLLLASKNPGGSETVQYAELLEESIVHTTGFVELELDYW